MTFEFDAYVTAAIFDRSGRTMFALGDGSVRAVANACASNEIALLIPCHRVVRSDGALGGYRWGETRKKKLLAQEGAGAPR